MAVKATIIASLIALFLAFVKFIVGLLSGSVALLSLAIDSLLDSFVSILNTLALKKAEQNSNEKYNFGYEKLEGLVSLIEAFIISGVGLFILFQSLKKLFTKEEISFVIPALLTILFCIFVSLLLVFYLNKILKKENSLILKADILHYKVDLLTNSATFLALLLIYFSEFYIIDAIFGILISLYTIFGAYKIAKDGFEMLLDKALDKEIVDEIKNLILANDEVKTLHLLKSRSTAKTNYLSVHLVFSPTISLLKAHDISHDLEAKIRQKFDDKKWEILMHLDPYDDFKKDLNENSTHSA